MQGKIVKGIAGFYYVHVSEAGIFECKANAWKISYALIKIRV